MMELFRSRKTTERQLQWSRTLQCGEGGVMVEGRGRGVVGVVVGGRQDRVLLAVVMHRVAGWACASELALVWSGSGSPKLRHVLKRGRVQTLNTGRGRRSVSCLASSLFVVVDGMAKGDGSGLSSLRFVALVSGGCTAALASSWTHWNGGLCEPLLAAGPHTSWSSTTADNEICIQ